MNKKISEQELILNNAKKAKIISFDLFDTVILRPFAKPKDVFEYIGIITKNDNFATQRIDAERKAREQSNFEEITLDEIYQQLPQEYKNYQKIEEETEYNISIINPKIKQIIDTLSSQNKKIIFTSDMYLNEKTIKKILQKHKLENIKIYLSSTIRKTKSTGTLFTHILQELKEKPKNILHIGDNKKSDYDKPLSIGLKTILINKYTEQTAIDYLTDFKNQINNIEESIIFALSKLNQYNKTNNYWYNLGYCLGGPLIFSYTQFINNIVKDKELNELIFVARDGYLLEKIFKQFFNNKIKTHYIYASRGLIHNTKIDETQNKEYDKYIQESNIIAKNIGLIDTTTMNFSAQNFLISKLPNKNIHGIYWLANEETPHKINYNYIFPRPHKVDKINFLIETLISAPHPPVNNILNSNPQYGIVSIEEEKRCKIYQEIEEGVLNFISNLNELFNIKKLDFKPLSIVELIYSYINNYKEEDLVYFQQMIHADGILNDQIKQLDTFLTRIKPINSSTVIQTKPKFSKFTYYRYKVLSKILWGKKRKKYKEKYKELKKIKKSLKHK